MKDAVIAKYVAIQIRKLTAQIIRGIFFFFFKYNRQHPTTNTGYRLLALDGYIKNVEGLNMFVNAQPIP